MSPIQTEGAQYQCLTLLYTSKNFNPGKHLIISLENTVKLLALKMAKCLIATAKTLLYCTRTAML